ncbi:Fucoxanthin-chlorophyll a-c binding protein F, partial [Durusdinium trenchii]
TQHHSDWFHDWHVPDLADTTVSWDDWLYNNDPIEAIIESTYQEANDMNLVPESLASTLSSCFSTHRENRLRLARAVQSRGYWVKGGKGKGKGKSSKGAGKGSKGGKPSKGRGKGGSGKARGMSLDELKAQTACAECGMMGHWKDECPNRKSNVTRNYDDEHYGDQDYDNEENWDYGPGFEGDEWTEENWQDWWPEQDAGLRSSHTTLREPPPAKVPPVNPPTKVPHAKVPPVMPPTQEELDTVASLKRKTAAAALPSRPSTTSKPKNVAVTQNVQAQQLKDQLISDDFINPRGTLATVRGMLEARPASVGDDLAAVQHARDEFNAAQDFQSLGSVWSLLREDKKGPSAESLRKRSAFMSATIISLEEAYEYENDFNQSARTIPFSMSPRTSLSLTRRQPTVEQGRIYLTIDTACENTVTGSSGMEDILVKLKAIGLMPLQEPEREQYCFGPGPPKVSTVRLSVPIGIGGVPLVIRTSLIKEDEGAPNKIPFLAGQDWLVFMEAVIDLGRNTMWLPTIQKEIPLYVDVTGHLVIAVDEYPAAGWPPGLTTRVDRYPGAIFTVYKGTDTDTPKPLHSQPTKDGAARVENFAYVPSPNYVYEPNDDDMNVNKPRQRPFTLDETPDSPDPQSLGTAKVTIIAGAPDYLVNIVYDMNHKSMGDICEEDLEAKLDSFTYHYNPCKKSPLGNWQHFVLRMNIMWQAMVRWQSCNKVVRELQHRALALCSYMESMIQLDSQEILPATCPPATTNPSGRTRKVMPTPYPFTVERCPHDAEAARRYGNAHGRFMECLQCGAVRKAFNEDYMNPITGEKVVVHGIRHGRKKQPGGKIEPVLRDSPNLSAKLASCYSLSSLPTSDLVAHKLSTSTWPKKKFGYDIVEVFGGSSMVTIRASAVWGLRCMQPIDI